MKKIKDKNKKNEICIYDVFTELYSKFHLTPRELFLYCFLYTLRNHKLIVKTSIETIHQFMHLKFHNSRPELNRRLIAENLISLKNKKIISFEADEELLLNKRSGKSTGLNIEFNDLFDCSGYLKIDYENFYSQVNITHFYINVAVKRYDNIKNSVNGLFGRWISLQEFADLIGINRRTFINISNEMIKNKMLFKYTGMKKESSDERDKNRYRTIPFPDESKNTYENRNDGNRKANKRKDQNRNVWGDDFPF